MTTEEKPILIAGSQAGPLAGSLSAALGVGLAPLTNTLFPDGEREIRLRGPVRGRDVFVVQPTAAPVGESLLELRLLADACWRAGAARLVGVVPYFGYARQDRRKHEGEPLGMRVAADLLGGAGLSRLLVVDLHSPASEGVMACPVDQLSALGPLCDAVRPLAPANGVVVSPDLGAARLARIFARRLGLPMALVHKTRLSGREVSVADLVGDVRDRVPILVDNMISTGGTIAAALEALGSQGSRQGAIVVATHGLLLPGVAARLAPPAVSRVLVSDSVDGGEACLVPVDRVSLGPLLADAILRIHQQRPLDELLGEGR
jgi:ribose-phosphate pyrophosphokinase